MVSGTATRQVPYVLHSNSPPEERRKANKHHKVLLESRDHRSRTQQHYGTTLSLKWGIIPLGRCARWLGHYMCISRCFSYRWPILPLLMPHFFPCQSLFSHGFIHLSSPFVPWSVRRPSLSFLNTIMALLYLDVFPSRWRTYSCHRLQYRFVCMSSPCTMNLYCIPQVIMSCLKASISASKKIFHSENQQRNYSNVNASTRSSIN